MAIKDKNGKVYRLRGTNPLMKEQLTWDTSKINLINFKWKSEVIVDNNNPIKQLEETIVDLSEEINKVIKPKDFIEEIQHIEEKKEEVKPIILNVEPRTAKILKERGVEYHCAPAIGEIIHKDDLYDSSYKTIKFGEKFIFDAVILDQSDLQLQFWCVKPITTNSIVYRKHPEGGERWWAIQQVEPKSDGYIALATISDLNPDFS